MKSGVCRKVQFLPIDKQGVLIMSRGVEKVKTFISGGTFSWHLRVRTLETGKQVHGVENILGHTANHRLAILSIIQNDAFTNI